MKSILRALGFAFILAGSPAFGAGTTSILEIAKSNGNFSTLVTALEIAQIDYLFRCQSFLCSSYTVFAPTNDAFANLPAGVLDTLTTNKEFKRHLTKILLYHATLGVVKAADISDGDKIPTLLLGESVNASVSNGVVTINESPVILADVEASNGFIHAIGKSILLPDFMSKDIVDVASSTGIFNTLLAAAEAAGIVDTLKTTSPITVFAPSDKAFQKLGQETIDALLQNTTALKNILTYHVIPDTIVFYDELTEGKIFTLQGGSITVSFAGWFHWTKVLNGGTNIIKSDVLASNGVIHVIDSVLSPSDAGPADPTIVELAVSNDNLKTLVAAVTAAGLVDTLNGNGPFTVFAPTDEAFAELGEATFTALLADPTKLANILKYHVVSGAVFSSDLETGSVETLSGASINVDVSRWWFSNFYLLNGESLVVNADNKASNGVVHIINKVLMPPQDILATATAQGLVTLVAAVEAANLTDALQGNGPFTIFAPTEAAFSQLGAGTLTGLLADPAALKDILLYHVVSGRVALHDLQNGYVKTLKQGSSIKVAVRYFLWFFLGVELNGSASIVDADIDASNGIIHAIDEVLAF